MTKEYTLKAWQMPKKTTGGAINLMREGGFIPAMIYGGGAENKKIALSVLAIRNYIEKHPEKNGVLVIEHLEEGAVMRLAKGGVAEGKVIAQEKCILRGIQLHPVTDLPLHVEMQRVTPSEAVKVSIKVRALNTAVCPGIKRGGILNRVKRKITAYCAPDSIPSYIDVDLSHLDIGQAVHINDLGLDAAVIRPLHKDNFVILSVSGRDPGTAAGGK